MSLFRLLTISMVVCLPFLTLANPSPALEQILTLENPSRASEKEAANADKPEQVLPEDTTPRFLANELYINGNSLISREDLLLDMPEFYKISEEKDGESVESTYDFRSLIYMIREPGLESNISLKTIQGFTKYLLSVYQAKGYGGIYVYVPASSVEEGSRLVNKRLHVQVLEAKLEKIEIQRYDFDREERSTGFLKESVIRSWSPVKEGDVIKKKQLDDFVNRLNLNLDRYVSPVISKSEDPNALDLSYDVYEASPWHTYIQADNAGTDDRQWAPRVGVVNTNLLGFDDSFSVMFQGAWEKGIEDEYALFSSYTVPVLTDRLRLNLYGGRSEFDVPGLSGIDFLGNGSFYGTGLNYTLFQAGKWFFDATGSISHEQSKITPTLGTQSDVDMDLWGSGFTIHRSNELSKTSLSYNRIESMGGSSYSDFQLARLGASPQFTIHTASVAHSQYLDAGKKQRVRGTYRYMNPDERLVPAKMTSFGGLYSVRGYDESEIVADGGYILQVQYEYNLIDDMTPQKSEQTDLSKKQAQKTALRKFAPLAFIDYGRAKIKDPVPGETPIQKLSSIGTGLLIEWGDHLSADIYYGWALRSTTETDEGDGRFNFSLMCRF